MGGRDHSVDCEKCGASYGGFNGPDECDCELADRQFDKYVRGHKRGRVAVTLANAVSGEIDAPGLPPITSLVLHCPKCGTLHLDVGEWRDKPHKTHLCLNEECGHLFRPVEAHTRGVAVEEATAGDILDSLLLTCTLDELRAIVADGRRADCGHLRVLSSPDNLGDLYCTVCV